MSQPLSLESEFWLTDGSCLLLHRSNGFLTAETAPERCAEFKALADKIPSNAEYEKAAGAEAKETGNAEFDRIFKEDAKRTFTGEMAQNAEVETLRKVFAHVKDYHQGLGFIVAFLRLFLSEQDAVKMCCYLSDTACSGYFKLENEEYLRDCYIFDGLLKEPESISLQVDSGEEELLSRLKSVAEKLARSTFSGQYLSKWFIGFCVHVFPYDAIFSLFERVISEPEKTTWSKFAVAFLLATSDDIIKKATNTSEIIQVLKFDNKLYPDGLTIRELCPSLEVTEDLTTNAYIWIVEFSSAIQINPEKLDKVRMEVDKYLEAQRIARQAHNNESSEEFNFSDEDD